MTTEATYLSRVTAMSREDLLLLWNQVVAGDTPGWDAGRALEYLILRAFQLEGADVRWPFSVKLADETVEQIDGVVYADGLACLIEVKDQSTPLSFEAIAKLRSQLARRPASTVGLLFSRGGFTPAARILTGFVAPQTILLWEGADITNALARQQFLGGLRRKYQLAVENGLGDWNSRS